MISTLPIRFGNAQASQHRYPNANVRVQPVNVASPFGHSPTAEEVAHTIQAVINKMPGKFLDALSLSNQYVGIIFDTTGVLPESAEQRHERYMEEKADRDAMYYFA